MNDLTLQTWEETKSEREGKKNSSRKGKLKSVHSRAEKC